MDILEPRPKVYEVTCPYCGRLPRRKCVTTGTLGHQRTPHHVRWEKATRKARSGEMWFLLLVDDPRFGLEAGDILRCVTYPWDSKVSVLFREWDGYNPECNQYLHDVAFIGFVPDDMHTNQ